MNNRLGPPKIGQLEPILVEAPRSGIPLAPKGTVIPHKIDYEAAKIGPQQE